MNESEKRVEATELIDQPVRPTSQELIELSTPGTEYTRPIGVEEYRFPDLEEVEETEVTPENYQDFLPDYTDQNPPEINRLALINDGQLVDEEGKLLPEAQAEWDQPPPTPQESFVDSSAGI